MRTHNICFRDRITFCFKKFYLAVFLNNYQSKLEMFLPILLTLDHEILVQIPLEVEFRTWHFVVQNHSLSPLSCLGMT